MKTNHTIGKLSMLMIVIVIFSFPGEKIAFNQEKMNVSLGFGMPELLNAGFRYQMNQTQLGISMGTVPATNETVISISGDVFYHFGGHSDFSSRRPWYGRMGLDYLRDQTRSILDEYSYLSLRIGRDLNISRKIGFNIDLGAMFQLWHQKTEFKPSGGWNFNFEFPFLPSIGIGLFYRI